MDQETRLDIIERVQSSHGGRLETIEKTQTSHGGKLDEIIRHVTVQQATPKFDLHAWIRTAGSIVTASAVLCTLVIWTIVRTTEKADAVLEARQSYTERKLDAVVNMLDIRPTYSVHGKTDKVQ